LYKRTKKSGQEAAHNFKTSNCFFSTARQTGRKEGGNKLLAATAQFVAFTKQPIKKSVKEGMAKFLLS